jgi:hypothetical protein
VLRATAKHLLPSTTASPPGDTARTSSVSRQNDQQTERQKSVHSQTRRDETSTRTRRCPWSECDVRPRLDHGSMVWRAKTELSKRLFRWCMPAAGRGETTSSACAQVKREEDDDARAWCSTLHGWRSKQQVDDETKEASRSYGLRR